MPERDSQPGLGLAMRRLMDGYQVSQALHVVATLGLADLLADGPRSSDELAAATACQPRALYRLLRALASVDVFTEEVDGRFALTALGACLRRDAPEPLAGWAAFVGRPFHWHVWGDLLESVRTGESAYPRVHGMSGWEYRAAHPDEGAIFDRAMLDNTRRTTPAILAAYDFGAFRTLVDVGGGRGALLAALLQRYSELTGTLFDQAHVVAGAAPVLEAAGVADRCTLVGGDFFAGVPAGADAYVLKAIIHDWDDVQAVAILAACRQALPATGKVLLIEWDLDQPATASLAKFSDLNMLVDTGGRERTTAEYRALFAAAGLALTRVAPTGVGVSVFEAVPHPA